MLVQKLYRIESKIKDMTAEEKLVIRKEKSLPLLNEFKNWLDKTVNQVAPKTAIGKAVAYTLNQWTKLTRFCGSGKLAIDNNRAERAIKPFVIGRKNWLFSNTSSGAHASAILYSLIETAKANGVDCFAYLSHLLTELPKQEGDIDKLMPRGLPRLKLQGVVNKTLTFERALIWMKFTLKILFYKIEVRSCLFDSVNIKPLPKRKTFPVYMLHI